MVLREQEGDKVTPATKYICNNYFSISLKFKINFKNINKWNKCRYLKLVGNISKVSIISIFSPTLPMLVPIAARIVTISSSYAKYIDNISIPLI